MTSIILEAQLLKHEAPDYKDLAPVLDKIQTASEKAGGNLYLPVFLCSFYGDEKDNFLLNSLEQANYNFIYPWADNVLPLTMNYTPGQKYELDDKFWAELKAKHHTTPEKVILIQLGEPHTMSIAPENFGENGLTIVTIEEDEATGNLVIEPAAKALEKALQAKLAL